MKSVTVAALLDKLPPYEDKWVLVHPSQSVKDIIGEVLDAHKEFAPYYDNIALFFDGDSTEEICQNLYNFCKKNIQYQEEKEEAQTSALPTGILHRGCGDCKHYSGFSGGVLDALNRVAGKQIKWNYRFASYDVFNKTPHHVFIVVNDHGRETWIDPTPGAENQTPVWQIDKKVKVSPMALHRNIAGIPVGRLTSNETVFTDELPVLENEELSPVFVEMIEEREADEEVTAELQTAIEVLLHYGVVNEKGEVSDKVLSQLAGSLPMEEFEQVSNARQVLQVYINKGMALGGVFSDIWRGVKKVTLAVPRNAYLSLVALNVFGYATKLYNAIYQPDGTFFQPNQDQLYQKWHSLGGDWKNLRNAINSGHKKKAILGCAETATVGVAPAVASAWVAVAAGIIAAIMPLVKELLQAKSRAGQLPSNINPNTGLPYGANPGAAPAGGGFDIMDFLQKNPFLVAAGLGVAAYFISDKPKRRS